MKRPTNERIDRPNVVCLMGLGEVDMMKCNVVARRIGKMVL